MTHEGPLTGTHARFLLKGYILPSAVLTCLVLVMTEAAGYAFAGRENQARISLRLFIEDQRLAWASLAAVVLSPVIARFTYPLAGLAIKTLRRPPLALATAATLVFGLGASLIMLQHPLSADEAAAVFQARVFAAGEATGQIPPALVGYAIPADYHGFFYDVDPVTGRVASNYWPVYALMMAPFAAAGVSFLLNPLLGGLSLIALYRLASRLYPGTDAPALTLLFAVASPAFVFNAMSFFAMPAHLLANTVWVILILVPTARRLLAAGLLGGCTLLLHSPYPHALFALPWLIWLIGRKGGVRRAGALAAGYLFVLLILGGWWMWVHAGIQGVPVLPREGFGQATHENPLESVRYAFHLPDATVLWVRATDAAKVVIWSAPGLVLLAIIGIARRWARIEVRLLAASALCLLLGYLMVFFDQGAGWSSRYFHPVWFVLPILAAGGLVRLSNEPAFPFTAVRHVAITAAFIAVPLSNAAAAIGAHRVIAAHLAQRPAIESARRQVVVMDPDAGYYVRDLIHNDPFLRGPVVYLLSSNAFEDAGRVESFFPQARLARRDSVSAVWWIDD